MLAERAKSCKQNPFILDKLEKALEKAHGFNWYKQVEFKTASPAEWAKRPNVDCMRFKVPGCTRY
jgi:hypothetical protein